MNPSGPGGGNGFHGSSKRPGREAWRGGGRERGGVGLNGRGRRRGSEQRARVGSAGEWRVDEEGEGSGTRLGVSATQSRKGQDR